MTLNALNSAWITLLNYFPAWYCVIRSILHCSTRFIFNAHFFTLPLLHFLFSIFAVWMRHLLLSFQCPFYYLLTTDVSGFAFGLPWNCSFVDFSLSFDRGIHASTHSSFLPHACFNVCDAYGKTFLQSLFGHFSNVLISLVRIDIFDPHLCSSFKEDQNWQWNPL